MSAVAIEYLKKHADYGSRCIEFWPGLYIQIRYPGVYSQKKYSGDILVIRDDTDLLVIARLAYDLLPKDEVLPYMFNRLEAGPNSARSRLIERLNEILIERFASTPRRVNLPGKNPNLEEMEHTELHNIAVQLLPGTYPDLEELDQTELDALTDQQQYDAYIKAFEMFYSVFWPGETISIRRPSKLISEPRIPESPMK